MLVLVVIILISGMENVFGDDGSDQDNNPLSDPVMTYCYLNDSVSDLFEIRLNYTNESAEKEQIERYCTEIGKFLECAESMPETNTRNALVDYFSSIRECQLLKDKQEDSKEFKCLLEVRSHVSQKCGLMCSKPSFEDPSVVAFIVKTCERLRCIKLDCLMGKGDSFQRTPGSLECRNIGQRVMDEDYKKFGKFIALTVLKAIGKYNADVTACENFAKLLN